MKVKDDRPATFSDLKFIHDNLIDILAWFFIINIAYCGIMWGRLEYLITKLDKQPDTKIETEANDLDTLTFKK